ncbi:MAG: hypothetical protein NVSMB64_10730 [Candidatus Velthaea sp.]
MADGAAVYERRLTDAALRLINLHLSVDTVTGAAQYSLKIDKMKNITGEELQVAIEVI